MRYYIPALNQGIQNASEIPGIPFNVREGAEIAARHIFNLSLDEKVEWPCLIVVVGNSGQEWRCMVKRVEVPHFTTTVVSKGGKINDPKSEKGFKVVSKSWKNLGGPYKKKA